MEINIKSYVKMHPSFLSFPPFNIKHDYLKSESTITYVSCFVLIILSDRPKHSDFFQFIEHVAV